MSVKLSDAAKEAFGGVRRIELSDERREELLKAWRAARERDRSNDFFGELATAEDLNKQQCTF